jgi:DNA-directed RNA polymerase specialized sigma24 family protein/ribosome-associated translation inhibitor RaiA
MNVHISYKLRRTPDIDHEIQHWTEKIQKRLQVFRPDLVHLKGLIEQNTPRTGTVMSLNLRLPSGQMAVQESAVAATAAIKAAFDELLSQIGKHKELLRNSHRWRGRRAEKDRNAASVPFESTIAAIPPLTATAEDVRSHIDANFLRLGRFVERELFLRESASELQPGSLSAEEIVDEVAARALDDQLVKPDRMALEPWLYRLAIRVMDEFTSRLTEDESDVHLQGLRRRRNERASDEPQLQFHQPDEAMTTESIIADDRAATPEEIAYTDEMVRLIQFAMRGARPRDREAFILHALEGFSAEEIALITDRRLEQVHEAIGRAREQLRYTFPSNEPFKRKMAQHTGTR